MNLIRALSIIFGCLFAGEALEKYAHIPLPGSILGLIMLTILLQTHVVKAAWIEEVSRTLIQYMGFFFIPPGVGLISYLALIRAEWCPILVSVVISTLLVLISTAVTYKYFNRRKERREK